MYANEKLSGEVPAQTQGNQKVTQGFMSMVSKQVKKEAGQTPALKNELTESLELSEAQKSMDKHS